MSFDQIRVYRRISVYNKPNLFHPGVPQHLQAVVLLLPRTPTFWPLGVSNQYIISQSIRSLPVLQTRGASRPSQPTPSPASPHISRISPCFSLFYLLSQAPEAHTVSSQLSSQSFVYFSKVKLWGGRVRWKRREAGICPQQTEMEIVEREGSECRRMKGGETEWWGKGRERVQSVGGKGRAMLAASLRVR